MLIFDSFLTVFAGILASQNLISVLGSDTVLPKTPGEEQTEAVKTAAAEAYAKALADAQAEMEAAAEEAAAYNPGEGGGVSRADDGEIGFGKHGLGPTGDTVKLSQSSAGIPAANTHSPKTTPN